MRPSSLFTLDDSPAGTDATENAVSMGLAFRLDFGEQPPKLHVADAARLLLLPGHAKLNPPSNMRHVRDDSRKKA